MRTPHPTAMVATTKDTTTPRASSTKSKEATSNSSHATTPSVTRATLNQLTHTSTTSSSSSRGPRLLSSSRCTPSSSDSNPWEATLASSNLITISSTRVANRTTTGRKLNLPPRSLCTTSLHIISRSRTRRPAATDHLTSLLEEPWSRASRASSSDRSKAQWRSLVVVQWPRPGKLSA